MRTWILLCGSMLLMAPACQDQAGSMLRRSKIARSWLEKRPDSVQMWYRSFTFDPYEQGYGYPADPHNLECLELASNGTFHEYDSARQSFGQWFVNPAESTLSLRYEIRNGHWVQPDDPEGSGRQVYLLKQMTSDSLVLEVQGRHGMMVITYLPMTSRQTQPE